MRQFYWKGGQWIQASAEDNSVISTVSAKLKLIYLPFPELLLDDVDTGLRRPIPFRLLTVLGAF